MSEFNGNWVSDPIAPVVAEAARVNHAAQRWAYAVFPIIEAKSDVRTLAIWSRHVGAGVGTLRGWCRAAGESPKASLDFGRLVRAILIAGDEPWDVRNVLDIVDDRTVARLVKRSGLQNLTERPDLWSLLREQRLIRKEANVRAVTELLVAATGDRRARWAETDAEDTDLPHRVSIAS